MGASRRLLRLPVAVDDRLWKRMIDGQPERQGLAHPNVLARRMLRYPS